MEKLKEFLRQKESNGLIILLCVVFAIFPRFLSTTDNQFVVLYYLFSYWVILIILLFATSRSYLDIVEDETATDEIEENRDV
jgi:hypothetical protein